MEQSNQNGTTGKSGAKGFLGYASKRVIAGILIAIVGLWTIGLILSIGRPSGPDHADKPAGELSSQSIVLHDESPILEDEPVVPVVSKPFVVMESESEHAPKPTEKEAAPHKPEADSHEPVYSLVGKSEPVGVAFVQAAIAPLDYELTERWWGWRPNDIIDVTDNVNHFQLGVLEVTRRTVERLAENISRTGSTASFDKNLENARSTCFVIEAESYWFPSPEGRYKDGLKELERYAEKLKKNEATFYTRADSLIPLLAEFEHLLGSCDDNLVKTHEEDGSKVSFFQADDYFYYAKGVASAMCTILEAIEKDFDKTLERRNCLKDLHHAIESCEHATHIEPIIIMNSDLDSIFANHRANMAAHISHARFYVGILIKTLST